MQWNVLALSQIHTRTRKGSAMPVQSVVGRFIEIEGATVEASNVDMAVRLLCSLAPREFRANLLDRDQELSIKHLRKEFGRALAVGFIVPINAREWARMTGRSQPNFDERERIVAYKARPGGPVAKPDGLSLLQFNSRGVLWSNERRQDALRARMI